MLLCTWEIWQFSITPIYEHIPLQLRLFSKLMHTHTYTVIGTDATVSSPSPLSIEQLTMQPSHLPLNYNADSGEDADDEAATRLLLLIKHHLLYSLYRSISSSDQGMKSSATSHVPSAPNNLSPVKPLSPHLFSSDSSQVL